MHAVVVRVNINDSAGAMEELRRDVVPRVSQAPGFVAGYWTRKDNTGLSMTVWESEDAATQARERITQNMPQGVDLQDSEVREVIANA
jgi:heme-degrading monooxygenase HmoA